MFSLLAVTFSTLKSAAIALAAVNVAVVAATIVCLCLLLRPSKKGQEDGAENSSADPTE